MSVTSGELLERVELEIRSFSDVFTSGELLNFAWTASMETGWTFPIADSNTFRLYWIKDRIKRHLIHALLFDKAEKFRYKLAFLNQKFEHWLKMLDTMDKAFDKAKNENVTEFINATNVYEKFGTMAGTGFAYDKYGADITQHPDNKVKLNPNEND
jgi:hypothetical protein